MPAPSKRNGLVVLALVAPFALFPLPALAGNLHRDTVHADSFGNLVIHSPGGYKRILVGQGYAAEAYNATGSYYETDQPRVAEHHGETLHLRRASACDYQVVLLHGRSYMYGLPDGVVPTPAYDLCR